jgi:hypothetical protein
MEPGPVIAQSGSGANNSLALIGSKPLNFSGNEIFSAGTVRPIRRKVQGKKKALGMESNTDQFTLLAGRGQLSGPGRFSSGSRPDSESQAVGRALRPQPPMTGSLERIVRSPQPNGLLVTRVAARSR